MTTAQTIRSGALDIWAEQRGQGPDVLLIAGLGDPLEAWQAQLDGLSDRYQLIAFDNRGTGRTPLGDTPLSIEQMADDAAAILDGLDVPAAHVTGFSGGAAIAQELALRHPDRVRSLVLNSTWCRIDARTRAVVRSWRWMAESAPSDRDFLEGFLVWIYTARAHEDGTVAQIVDEMLTFPHPASTAAIQALIDAVLAHETADRLHQIAVPTLVLAGGEDIQTPPRLGREVAARIPGARFQVLESEAHQPFQEVPDEFNAIVDAFWREVDSRD